MSRTKLRKAAAWADNDEKGTWRPVNRKHQTDPNALFWCPKCGGGGAVHHAIAANGDLSPSLVCPHAGCDFHVWATLEGWGGGVLPSAK